VERGGVGKSGVLEHKSNNISETRKDRGKVTMEALWRPYRNSPTLFRTVQSGLENGCEKNLGFLKNQKIFKSPNFRFF